MMDRDDVIARFAYPGERKLGTHLTALPIGPDELLVTWQLSDNRIGKRKKDGDSQNAIYLRIHDVSDVDYQGDNSVRQWTYELNEDNCETVVKLDRPGLNVCAELVPQGRRGNEPLARTRPVMMPRQEAGVDSGKKRWMIFERS